MAKDPSNPQKNDQTPSVDPESSRRQVGMAGSGERLDNLAELIERLAKAGGIPIALSQTPPLKIDTADRLNQIPRVTVAMPPCTDELLSLIKTNNVTAKDDVTKYFDEYFDFRRHIVLGEPVVGTPYTDQDLLQVLDEQLLRCPTNDITIEKPRYDNSTAAGWPTECCICPPCVTLDGLRNGLDPNSNTTTGTPALPAIRRLFIGDLVWLFYFERMGIFQILGAILDAFACNGRYPISNGSLETGVRDDIVALVLEVMVRQTKTGMSSTVRDRTCAYRTSLGWTSDVGRKLSLDTMVSTGFNALFHKFIYHALEFYKDKRLAVAIRGTAATVSPPSVATLITISDTIDVLKKRFEAFAYGRNYYNTLSGIIWVIAGLSVLREVRTALGIPTAFGDPHEYIPAAYDLLVLKGRSTQGDSNRYLLHRECAKNGRDILLDLEVIDHTSREPNQELDLWLTQIESKVEAYRTAYRTLTGVDLGASGSPTIEQQA